jgi:DNA-binding HxlR family transcriptional regulator
MRRLDGITHKALADALKRLERNGLIRREVLTTTTPVGVEYTTPRSATPSESHSRRFTNGP